VSDFRHGCRFADMAMTNNQPPSVLIVEDDVDLRLTLAESLDAAGFAVAEAGEAADARERLEAFAYDALVVDLHLPDANGMSVFEDALHRYPDIKAIVMTGFGGVTEAVEAIKHGAIDFLIKPFQLAQLARVLSAAVEQTRLRLENAELRAQLHTRYSFDSIVGRDRAMRELFTTLELIAPMNSTVLIHGETGTGKELVARTIHEHSPRAAQRFVAFNAAALPEGLIEAELFGHVKGAFTGAVASRVGRFELAHRGTLFIDEVALMPLPLQAKLLRALQEREVERVGDSKPMKVDIRVIAATNTDLRKLVAEGRFREDLYYRLSVIPVTLPPLRDRRGDIPLLAQHMVVKACADNGLQPKPLTQKALRTLMAYHWPGNVRQLENALEYAVAMSLATKEIGVEALPEEIRGPIAAVPNATMTIPDEGLDFSAVVSQIERDLIVQCLEKTGGNKRQAAKLLNLSRTTFLDKLQRLLLIAPGGV
jgi:DNA-binding NtrC family response regulator